MQDVFRTLDEDGSGSLEIAELETAIKSMGVEYSEKDMTNLVQQMDADGMMSFCFTILYIIFVYFIPKTKFRDIHQC